MLAGYSFTPLLKKLGLKVSDKIVLINQPFDYYDLIEKDVSGQFCNSGELPDFVHAFVTSEKDLISHLKTLTKKIKPTTVIWISWYKKSSGINTDVTEDVIRRIALENQLVDVKVCAVSEIWSGLKLVVPSKLR